MDWLRITIEIIVLGILVPTVKFTFDISNTVSKLTQWTQDHEKSDDQIHASLQKQIENL